MCRKTKPWARPNLWAAPDAACIQLNAAAPGAIVVELPWKSFPGVPVTLSSHVSLGACSVMEKRENDRHG